MNEFKAALEEVPRVDNGPGGALFETEELMGLQFTASSGPSSSNSLINPEDIPAPFRIVEKGAGGDCLFYALGEMRKDIKAVRSQLGLGILAGPDDVVHAIAMPIMWSQRSPKRLMRRGTEWPD